MRDGERAARGEQNSTMLDGPNAQEEEQLLLCHISDHVSMFASLSLVAKAVLTNLRVDCYAASIAEHSTAAWAIAHRTVRNEWR